ncbi:CoA transferase [Sphingobium sp. Sx8-8]|uniref:CoA transferase n=1 Tax=Sphingobium sp. Sx8-8 TaxID=2933617 RepID=UPI001F55B037|nr:CoA transferase [Sphingobium sp. Sx8-8]
MTTSPLVVKAAAAMTGEIARLTRDNGKSVEIDPVQVLDRSDSLPLREPGLVSPNGSCRLIEARDGWIAVNLPRPDDAELVPAWTFGEMEEDPWAAIAKAAGSETTRDFIARGAELGLAVAQLGEIKASSWRALSLRSALARPAPVKTRLKVVDLSTLWAGPLCGGILAAAGHDVVKAESRTRPDPVASATPLLDRRLNGAKRRMGIDFDRSGLMDLLAGCDILITSARPRAFEALDVTPDRLFAANPALIWVAVTGHGWSGEAAFRTGFGDDAAVAGGLVDWQGGLPRFAGDAVADPLTGLAAAIAAIEAAQAGGGRMIDAALSRTAAGVAALR